MPAQTYKCDIDAEPLHRYQPGGYHPLGLGDVLKDGRYKILHKLGWGSYSTTWAAKDQRYVYLYQLEYETLFANSRVAKTNMSPSRFQFQTLGIHMSLRSCG